MFWLLFFFSEGEKKTAIAPQLYKNLSFALIDNYSDSNTREFIEVNLIKVFEKFPKIPVGMVVEPMVKQLQLVADDAL